MLYCQLAKSHSIIHQHLYYIINSYYIISFYIRLALGLH